MKRIAPMPPLLGLVLVLASITPRQTLAHAIIIESTPALNTEVTGSVVPIDLRFNSRIDKKRSRMAVIKPDKTSQKLVFPLDGDADRITATATDLTPGSYQIEWQVLGIDGHITRGFIPFAVKAP